MFADLQEEAMRNVSWNAPRDVPGNVPSWMAPRTPQADVVADTPPPPRLPEIEIVNAPEEEPAAALAPDMSAEIALLQAEIDRLRGSLASAATELVSERTRVLAESEEEMVKLALAIAERVALRVVAENVEVAHTWVREGLAAIGEKSARTVTVSRDLAAAFTPELIATLDATFEIDDALQPGSCVVRSSECRVDGSVNARIRTISSALGVR